MINFNDTTKINEVSEAKVDTKGFKEIKSDSPADKEKCFEFVKNLFSKESENSDSLEEQLLNDIYDRFEDEFKFDEKSETDKVKDSLEKFYSDDWEHLSEEEKLCCLDKFADELAESLGLDEKPYISFYEADENDCGSYNSYNNTISINKSLLNDPKELVDTLAHETRHAYQYQRANIGETYTDKLYKVNFDNYVVPQMFEGNYVNFNDYYNQFVEAEARAYAKVFRNYGERNE